MAIQAMDIDIALSYVWTMDSDKVLGSSLGLDVNMAVIGSVDHSNWHGPSSSVGIQNTYIYIWLQVWVQIPSIHMAF